MTRPTSAIIDTSALRDNFALAQKLGPSAKSMPMVKANAYGHGMLEVAHALEDMAPAYGVACIEEALELSHGVNADFVLLGGDLFHEHRPSADTYFKASKIFNKHVFGEPTQEVQFNTINYEKQALTNLQ